MAIAVTNKLATGSSATASSYATASVSLTSGRLYLLTVRNTIGAGTATQPTVSGASATWTQIATNVYSGNSRRRTTVFRALASSTASGALTISFGGTNQSDADWLLDEFTGMNATGTNGANAIVQSVTNDDNGVNQTSWSVSLSAFAYSGNATYAVITGGGSAMPVTQKSGFTETGESTVNDFGPEGQFLASPDTSPSWTLSGSGAVWMAMALEIQAEPVAPSANVATTVAFTANNAKTTIKPTAGTATTVAFTANDATVSFLAPPRSVTINSTDYTNVIRWDSYSFTECANNTEVGIGGVDILDESSALSIPALKAGQFDEPQAGLSNKRVWTGFTHERSTTRGVQKVAGVREWGVELTDLNVLFSDFVLTAADSADRGIETDYARMVWLLTTVFGTSGSVSSGVVPNSNTVTMEATDYRGRKPADVASECLEASGKLCFIYDYGAGRKLYYDVATGTSLTSTAKISDVAADIDSSTTWAPYSPPTVKRSPDRIYSKIHLTYNGGTVTVSNATTASNYRPREASVLDASINDATLATAKANSLLTGASTELLQVENIAIAVPAANVNDVRAGQRMQIKLTRHGISSFTYYRVTRRTVTPLNDVSYLLSLTLASDVLPSANGGRGGDDIWPNKSNANDDGATVIVDRGGITITNGALTLTDEFGSTVMQSTGFAGSWADFIRLGLYNARLQTPSATSIATGRTSALPFWTVAPGGSSVLTGLSGGGVKATWSASTETLVLQSDRVPVQPGGVLEAAFAVLANRAAGNLSANAFVYWYAYDGSFISYTASSGLFTGASITTLLWIRDAVVVPDNAFTALMRFEMGESSHNASNSISIYAAKLQDIPVEIPPLMGVAASGAAALSPGSGTVNDYDPGRDSLTLLKMQPSGALTMTGLLAPALSIAYRTRWIFNYSLFAITLKNENAGSSAANRFATPGAADYVISSNGAAVIFYDITDSRWHVQAKS